MKRLLVLALLTVAAAFGQIQESVNPFETSSVQIGRNRTITEGVSVPKHEGKLKRFAETLHLKHKPVVQESRLPGKHNLVTVVARHPVAGCAKTEECGEVFYTSRNYNLVVNAGLNWLADIMGNTSTPSVNTQCNYIGLSNGAGTPAAGDTTLATTVGTEITTNGLGRAQATYAHTSNATTFTLAKTFTATGAQSAQAGAVFTAVSSGTMCYEDTFTSATLANGDTLTVTWTITI